jgi:hypothetical protein
VLNREKKLLADLIQVLRRQRTAVREDDLPVVDETVYSAQRVFRTLAEARRRRRALLVTLGVEADVSLEDLETVLGRDMGEEMEEARNGLRKTARRLSRELDVNRRVLEGALSSGERLMRGLTGSGGGESAGVYGPGARSSDASADSGAIINRQI